MRLILSINLGNDAMQDGTGVARVLRKVAYRIEDYSLYRPLSPVPLLDGNGNAVGTWEVQAESETTDDECARSQA